MFRFFEFIVFFLIGYKIIRMVFSEIRPKQKVRSTAQNQNINSNTYQQRTTPKPASDFDDAEFIDYEEVK
jgi:hypothetical protein